MSLNSCAHRQPIVMLLRSAGLLPLPRCCGPARKDGRDRRLSPAGWMRALLLLLPRDHCKAQGEGGEGSPTATSCPVPDGCFSVLFLTPVSKHPPLLPVRTPGRVWVFAVAHPSTPAQVSAADPSPFAGIFSPWSTTRPPQPPADLSQVPSRAAMLQPRPRHSLSPPGSAHHWQGTSGGTPALVPNLGNLRGCPVPTSDP